MLESAAHLNGRLVAKSSPLTQLGKGRMGLSNVIPYKFSRITAVAEGSQIVTEVIGIETFRSPVKVLKTILRLLGQFERQLNMKLQKN